MSKISTLKEKDFKAMCIQAEGKIEDCIQPGNSSGKKNGYQNRNQNYQTDYHPIPFNLGNYGSNYRPGNQWETGFNPSAGTEKTTPK